LSESLRNSFKPVKPLKPRLDNAIRRLEMQINQLDRSSERFNQKDRDLFAKIIDAYTKHDTARANVYANELAEVRKMERITINARLALDQVLLRLKTVTEFGDIVSALGPAISVLRSVSGGLAGVFPEAENELGEIGNVLSGVMFEAAQTSGTTLNFNNVNDDASKILAEAAAVAEQKMNANLPELPQGWTTAVQGKTSSRNP